MTATIAAAKTTPEPAPGRTDWVAVARELGPGFASRAAAYDANDSFPRENYQELKEHRVFAAPVPAELGGGGASYPELCSVVRELGRRCGATALSVSMHLHLVGTLVWVWRQGGPVATWPTTFNCKPLPGPSIATISIPVACRAASS